MQKDAFLVPGLLPKKHMAIAVNEVVSWLDGVEVRLNFISFANGVEILCRGTPSEKTTHVDKVWTSAGGRCCPAREIARAVGLVNSKACGDVARWWGRRPPAIGPPFQSMRRS